MNLLTGSSQQDIHSRLALKNCSGQDLNVYYIYQSVPVEVTKMDDRYQLQKVQSEFMRIPVDYLRSLIRLLRLYNEGNIQMPFMNYYFVDSNGIKRSLGMVRSNKEMDLTRYRLEINEISDIKNFIKNIKIPFNDDIVKLAFENFEASYEVRNSNLKFLTLMNTIEVLFHPYNDYELTYQISRNFAVLLGKDKKDSEDYYDIMKKLYGKRSGIVHRGKADITDEDILKLRHYVRESIKAFLILDQSKKEILESLHSGGFGDSPIKRL